MITARFCHRSYLLKYVSAAFPFLFRMASSSTAPSLDSKTTREADNIRRRPCSRVTASENICRDKPSHQDIGVYRTQTPASCAASRLESAPVLRSMCCLTLSVGVLYPHTSVLTAPCHRAAWRFATQGSRHNVACGRRPSRRTNGIGPTLAISHPSPASACQSGFGIATTTH